MKKTTVRMLGALLLSAAVLILATGCPHAAGDNSVSLVPHQLKDTVWKVTLAKGEAVDADTLYIYFVGNNAELNLAKRDTSNLQRHRRYTPHYTSHTASNITSADLGFYNAGFFAGGTTMTITVAGQTKISADKVTDGSVTVNDFKVTWLRDRSICEDFKND